MLVLQNVRKQHARAGLQWAFKRFSQVLGKPAGAFCSPAGRVGRALALCTEAEHAQHRCEWTLVEFDHDTQPEGILAGLGKGHHRRGSAEGGYCV